MLTARTRFVSAAIVSLLGCLPARADYVSQTVPLNSSLAGPGVGMVVAEANASAGGTDHGLLPGQVRLTFSVNPSAAYGQIGPHFGFFEVVFNTDVSLGLSQITVPSGYSAALGDGLWHVQASTNDAFARTVTVLVSGLGSQATLSHFVLPAQSGVAPPIPDPPFTFEGGVVGFRRDTAGDSITSDVIAGDPVFASAEPSSLALGAAGIAGLVFTWIRRRIWTT